MFSIKKNLLIAGLTSMVSAGIATASPLQTLLVEASTSGTTGTYDTTVAPTGANTTLYFEVFAEAASPSESNANTGYTNNGASDYIASLPDVTLTVSSGSTFNTSALQNNFDTGSGPSAGTTGSSTLTFHAIEQGHPAVDDTTLVGVISGTLTVGADFAGIQATTVIPAQSGSSPPGGTFHIGTHNVGLTYNTESSTDPLLSSTNETGSVPEPASLGLLGVAAVAMMRFHSAQHGGRRRSGNFPRTVGARAKCPRA